MATLTVEAHSFPDTVTSNTQPPFEFTLRNGPTPFCGRYYVMLQELDGPHKGRLNYIQYQGLYLEPDQCTTRPFRRSYVRVAPGRYGLWVAYECTILRDTLMMTTREPLQQVTVVSAAAGIPDIKEDESRPLPATDLTGRPLPAGRRRRGIAVEHGKNGYRKILRQ